MQENPVLFQYFITKVCCKLGFNFPFSRSRFVNIMISVMKKFFEHLIMERGAKRLLTYQFNIQILKKGNSCHQRFAKQTSSAVATSDLFVV